MWPKLADVLVLEKDALPSELASSWFLKEYGCNMRLEENEDV
jgi:hypothetical protein